MKRLNLLDERYGRLKVIEDSGLNKYGRSQWQCECDCGNKLIVPSNSLRRGNTKSCGCLQKEKATKTLMDITITHGLSRDSEGNRTRLYRIWTGIKTRCFNPNVEEYPRYGGKGVRLCKEWLDYENFYNWAMSNGYEDTLSIDRIDSSGNYDPNNCRWATAKQQANNRTNNRKIKFYGKEKTLSEWADEFGISVQNLFRRLESGWSFERAITTPVSKDEKLRVEVEG